MTIKEFADLCGCNPQTLRYYDRENLLKPASVDIHSGYRFYDESQAITFVKIKNLQKAGFTIDDIKALLQKSDAEIYAAFEEIIEQEERRISEIKEIQKIYQTELIAMMNKIEEFREIVKESLISYDPFEEFDIDEKEYEQITKEIELLLDQIIEDAESSHFEFYNYKEDEEEKEILYFENCLNNPEYEIFYELHEWNYVKEFFNNIPKLDEDHGYLLLFKVNQRKQNKTAFANTAVSLFLSSYKYRLKLGCTVIDSTDDKNHFWLLRYED